MSRLFALERIALEGTLEEVENRMKIENVGYFLAGTPVPWMIDLLSTVSPHAPVCDIQLRFNLPFAWRSVIDVLYSHWSDLAKVLLSGRFPRLRRIMIGVKVNRYTDPTPYMDFRNHPALVDLNARGILDYKLCIAAV